MPNDVCSCGKRERERGLSCEYGEKRRRTPLQVVVLLREEIRRAFHDARVTKEQVELLLLGAELVGRPLDRVEVAQVELEKLELALHAALPDELFESADRVAGLGFVSAGDVDFGVLEDELLGRLEADSDICAGDDDDLDEGAAR